MNDMTGENLNALVNAANLKIEAQKKIQEQEAKLGPQQDIYASMREELEDTYEDFNQKQIAYSGGADAPSAPIIDHDAEPEAGFYVDEDNFPIFDDGPSIAQVELWKKQFSKEKVFHTQIIDRHFVFRTLNRFEYKQIVAINNIDALYREEIICNTCVLWPMHYDFKAMAEEDSGYPSTLAQIIMENSGFTKEYGIEVL